MSTLCPKIIFHDYDGIDAIKKSKYNFALGIVESPGSPNRLSVDIYCQTDYAQKIPDFDMFKIQNKDGVIILHREYRPIKFWQKIGNFKSEVRNELEEMLKTL